jgi:D-alanyl-D-alanine carboxypeptidase
MLWEGWSGIKTGITPNAGPCLAASYPIILKGRAYEFLIILLSSETMEARWKEAKSLISWIS